MIEWTITKDRPSALLPRTGVTLREAMNLNGELIGEQNLVEGITQRRLPWSPAASANMTKLGYAEFLSKVVMPLFPVGVKVTARVTAIRPDEMPTWWGIVEDVQEIHFMAQMDTTHKQPRCILVKSAKHSGHNWVCPDMLRRLSGKEEELCDDFLRNREKHQPTEEGTHGTDPTVENTSYAG